ncbi:bifunctional riboflavin kinase/FAD synthetase [Thorsellia anophelis]|nr:bifunctional riboflavin kinase/FAD synthetase [Thorsellia anophelis]
MQLIRGFNNCLSLAQSPQLSALKNGCALTIGNFDGVHLGHKALVDRLKQKAGDLPSVVMIFEPQPLEYFSPDKAPARLTHFRDKITALKSFKIDYVFCVPFNHHIAKLTAQEFVEDLLINVLNVKFLLIGDDFKFGANRQGDMAFLTHYADKQHFVVEALNTITLNEERISSTSIRKALMLDDLDHASSLLGRPYSISGRVIHGDKIGAQLGFPTANISMNRIKSAVNGVYAVHITGSDIEHLSGKSTLYGIANIGFRPTVAGKKHLLEVFIFDESFNLYGKHITVVLKHKIRSEQKFDGLEALKSQIQSDIEATRRYFGENDKNGSEN